ncbi:MAG: polysaccharide pyruvyl transferase family protein [Candidatus Nomurabacteria bacterium]|jgi:hypothetical protein|nr:polysaccharide pyruvyl transferase family protein [Candidatus Nomurabacteria bacterium]
MNSAKTPSSQIDGAIVTTTTNNNYGNVIQRWALQKFLQNNGYNFISYYFYGYYPRQYMIRQSWILAPLRFFILTLKGKRKNYIKSSSLYNYSKMSKFCNKRINQRLFLPPLNKKYQTYIVGSDQVFHYGVIRNEFFCSWTNFLLSFVKWPAKRITYAPSFGKDVILEPDNPLAQTTAKKLMQKFNSVSIREQSGITIAKKIWGIDAKEVVDPTILLSADSYRELIDNPTFKLHEVKPVFFYILRDTPDCAMQKFTQKIAKDLGKKSDGIAGYSSQDLPAVEQWLKGFADAELAVTDGFHGTVFSILNHTDFITICSNGSKTSGSATRYKNLLSKLGLSERLVYESSFKDFDVRGLPKINWAIVDKKLDRLRKESANWLLSQLANSKKP